MDDNLDMAVDSELECVKTEIINRYLFHKRKAIPFLKLNQYNKGAQTSFYKAAQYCSSKGIDPVYYVDCQMDHLDEAELKKFLPQFLTSAQAEAMLHNRMKFEEVNFGPAEMFPVYKRKLGNYLKTEELEEVLLDDTYTFPAWFRMVAPKVLPDSVARKYRDKANRECDPKLLAFLKAQKLDYTRFTS